MDVCVCACVYVPPTAYNIYIYQIYPFIYQTMQKKFRKSLTDRRTLQQQDATVFINGHMKSCLAKHL